MKEFQKNIKLKMFTMRIFIRSGFKEAKFQHLIYIIMSECGNKKIRNIKKICME